MDSGRRLRHTLHFADEATPTRRAKPSGVIGAEIWVKVAELQMGVASPPTDPSELTYLSMDTRSPYVARFPGADGGKTAHYMLRWMSTTGDKGPWSETASATIGA